MPGEFVLEYLPQELALMTVLFLAGLTLLVLVCLGGTRNKNFSIIPRWFLGILACIIMYVGGLGIYRIGLATGNENPPEPTKEEPTPTEELFYQAALFVKESFDSINNAGNLQDVATLMPKIFAPNLQRSADFWWDVRVKYEIYGCEENIIDVYLEYFNREDTFYNNKNNDSFSRHTLDFNNNEWIIIDGEDISGTNCPQVFSSLQNE